MILTRVLQAADRRQPRLASKSLTHKTCFFVNVCWSLFLKDDIPELAESFLVNISSVELIQGSEVAGQPSVKRPGMEVAEVTISENDDPRGILQFNVSDVSTLSFQTPSDNSAILRLMLNNSNDFRDSEEL